MSKSFSIHTGYVYSAKESFGFASVSSSNDHKAEAVHAALKPIFDWIVENQIKNVTLVSDSTVAQYRNAKNVFLVQSFARQNGITCQWLYTEAGHGKSVCDGIGGALKTKLKEAAAINPSLVIASPEDVIQIVQPNSKIHLSVSNYYFISEDHWVFGCPSWFFMA